MQLLLTDVWVADAEAQWLLGHAYKWGKRVKKNVTQALKRAKLSADQGNPNGQWLLGSFHYSGIVIEQDYVEAVKWYRLSAEQGNLFGRASVLVRRRWNRSQIFTSQL